MLMYYMAKILQNVFNLRLLTTTGVRLFPTFEASFIPFTMSDSQYSSEYFYFDVPTSSTYKATPDDGFNIIKDGQVNSYAYLKPADPYGATVTPITLKDGSKLVISKITEIQYFAELQNSQGVTLDGMYLTIYDNQISSYKAAGFCSFYITEADDYVLASYSIQELAWNRWLFTINFTAPGRFLQWYENSLAPADPYGSDDNQTKPGGYGPYDYTSEIETPPQLPALSAAQVGFVSLWNPTQSEMQGLANYLWTGTFDLTNFKKLFTDPMECVLSVGIIPITPTREATKREIVFGGSSHSGVNAYAVTEQFYIIDMGTLHITGMSQGALDYSPYAKASIYLPYCGTYALDVDEIMDSDISLEYHIDIYTGACVAYLTIDGHLNSDGKNVKAIMYQFTGNVLASIPITGNDHSQFIQSMLFMGAAAAATVATSGAGAGAAASSGADLGAETAATGFNKALAGSAVNTVMSMKPNVLHSGNLSTTAGMLGGQKPFITMTWSNLCRPEEEYKLVGMPLHKSGTLSDFSGFTIVSACHLDNILCTDAELQMIEQALAKGVII